MDTPPPAKRLRISELNPHLLCALCGGYLIDATTIIECLHSFCKTCIVRYLETSKYCPICEVLIHKTRPWQNIRLDHALQNAVYKMVPGLFQSEMKRRREFYEKCNSDGKQASKATTQTQGMLGSRIIFSHDEEFSISIEFSPNGQPLPETGTKSLKRHSNNCHQDKRYLKCPAGLKVNHLKKFIRSKFSLPSHILIDLFHSQEPLSDSFSLMDVAYIYLWKRDCVLRLFYSFYQKPAKREPVETITKTVAEKVKEKHEVKGRERERAEKEKEDQSKAAAKKEKDKGKDVKQGKISSKKEVPSLGDSEITPGVFKVEKVDTPKQGPNSKRKSTQSELQGMSSPSPDKKQKKASPISKISPGNTGLAASPIQAVTVQPSVSVGSSCSKNAEVQYHTESPCQPFSSCQKGNCQSSVVVTQTSNAKRSPLPRTHCSPVNVHLSHDKTFSSSSQKMKCSPPLAVSDIRQDSAGETRATHNQSVQTKDERYTPSCHMVSSMPTASPFDNPSTKSMPQKTESQNVSSTSVFKSNTPVASLSTGMTRTIPQTCPTVSTFTTSTFLNTPNLNFTPKYITSSSPSITSTVPRSNGQSSFISMQNTNIKYQTSLPDNTAIKSKPQSSVAHVNNIKVKRQCSPIPTQNTKLKCTVSGQTLPSGQTGQSTKVTHQNSPQGIVKGAANNQNLAVSVANSKSYCPVFPTSSPNSTKPYCLNPPTTNLANKTTSCTLTVISATVKPTLNPAPAAPQAKVNNSNSYPPSTVASPKTSVQSRRKSAQQTSSVESSSSSNGNQTPSPREESAGTCEYDVEMAEDDRFSPSQSNVFERMDLLAKMADSDGRPNKSSSVIVGTKGSAEQDYHPGQSPNDVCQSSPATKSSGCDDVEVISVEYIDSPKKSGDQSRCDDSVQSLKSDDSGVATTIEIEDDSMELPQKSHSPIPTTSPSPGLSQLSPMTNSAMCNQSKPVSDSAKLRAMSTPWPNVSCNSTDEESSIKKCSHVISNPITASYPVKCSKPASVLINSSCQTTETGSMTVDSSVLFPSRAVPTSEHRTMLRIPKDYIQATDLSSKSDRDCNMSSPDSDSKLTLCLPVSHINQLSTSKPSSLAECERSSRSVTSTDSLTNGRAQTGTNGSSVADTLRCQSKHLQSASSLALTNTSSCVSSSIQTEAIDLGSSMRASSVASSICGPSMHGQSFYHIQGKPSGSVISGSSNHRLPKEMTGTQTKTTISMQDGVIPKLTISNDSVKMTTASRKISVSEPVSDNRTKTSSLGMGKNVVSSTKSTQPLKLTVTLSNTDAPIKVSSSPRESKKNDHQELKKNDHQISSSIQTSKATSQSSKSHTVAHIIATSSSPSPPPAVTSKLNNNVIQTTKISTLIPKSSSMSSKSSSMSSKSSSFSKQFAYPSNINTVPSSRSFLPGAIPHLSRADMMGLINGTVSFSPNSMDKNSVLSSYSSPSPSSSSSSTMASNSSHHLNHHQHHHKSSSSSKHKDGGSGRFDKSSKAKTIPPLSIPKSCLISPPLKLQRSPGSTDHYIFTHQNPYLSSASTNHNGERQRSKESKNNGNRTPTSPLTSAKEGNGTGERQRVPSIKISDINRNPIIVESGYNLNNNSGNNTANHHHRSHGHGSSRSESGSGSGRRRSVNATVTTHSPDSAGPSSSSASSSSSSAPRSTVAKEHRRPSDSQILLNNPWHMHSAAAEFLFHQSFKIPATNKCPNLHYDTDAMPLDYSQSSSKL